MITEQVLKYVFQKNDVVFTKSKSLITIKYPKADFDEKGYPKGLTINYNQVILLLKYNDGEPIKFAINSDDFVHQLRYTIESLYLASNGLDYIRNNYISKGFTYCPQSNTLTKYFEPMGVYKEVFDSDELILLKAHIQSDRINMRFAAYQLNYY